VRLRIGGLSCHAFVHCGRERLVLLDGYPPANVVKTLFLLKPLPPEIQRVETPLLTAFKSGRR